MLLRHAAGLMMAASLVHLGPGAAFSQDDPIFDIPNIEVPTIEVPSLPSFDITVPSPTPPDTPAFTDFNVPDPGAVPINPDPLGRVKAQFPFEEEDLQDLLDELGAALQEALSGFGNGIRGRIPGATP